MERFARRNRRVPSLNLLLSPHSLHTLFRSPLAIATATHFANRFFAARSMAANNRFVC